MAIKEIPEGTKICTMCKCILNMVSFSKTKNSSDGLSCYCRRCAKYQRIGEYENNAEINRKKARKRRSDLRNEFLVEYGGVCACCGEDEVDFLTLEHCNGTGKYHRKKFRTTAQQLADIKKRGWPKDEYQILCFNCNRTSINGFICPHKTMKTI